MGAKNSRRSPGPRRDTQAYYSSSIVPATEQCMRHPATLLLLTPLFYYILLSDFAFIASGCTSCINRWAYWLHTHLRTIYFVQVTWQLYLWHVWLSCLLLNFAFRLRSIASGCTSMHQQMGLWASLSSSNNFVFFCSQVPWQLYY
jgi:hypothetical protein